MNHRQVSDVLLDQVRQMKRAYYADVPGVTYDDMAAAARRFLTMQAAIQRSMGRRPAPVTKAAIAHLLRSL